MVTKTMSSTRMFCRWLKASMRYSVSFPLSPSFTFTLSKTSSRISVLCEWAPISVK